LTVPARSFARRIPWAACLALGVCAAGAVAASATAPAPGATQPVPLVAPPANEVRVYDCPSDNGTTIILEWPKPVEAAPGAFYVVEIARSEGDFRNGNFRTLIVPVSPRVLKAANPRLFGFAPENRRRYYVAICPGDVFASVALTPVVLAELRTLGAVSDVEADRARALLADRRPKDQLTPAEQADRDLLKELETRAARVRDLERFVREELISPADAARARAVLRNPKPAGALTDNEKADRAWLEKTERLLSRKAKLKKHRAGGTLSQEQYDRAMVALEDPGGGKWLEHLETYLATKDQEAGEARAEEVNAGDCVLRLAIEAGAGPDKATAYVLRDGQPATWTARASADLFKRYKLNNLLFALVFSGIVLTFIQRARRNPNLFIRKIAGLEAIEEAIGRATEMGRSVYFVHGLHDMDSLSTIAAVNVLAKVARRAADYDTRVRVMNNRPIVTAVSQEVVQQAYTEAGRPDAYNADDVSLVATDQFSYVAAVSGMMVREKPAAIFFLGYFYAESLLLAETGASTGAIQVAGTDAFTQLPFFVTTCDYTLIGEELYAASAYLSREPRMLGSLRGQDVGKAFLMVVLIAGTAVLTIGAAVGANVDWLRKLLAAL